MLREFFEWLVGPSRDERWERLEALKAYYTEPADPDHRMNCVPLIEYRHKLEDAGFNVWRTVPVVWVRDAREMGRKMAAVQSRSMADRWLEHGEPVAMFMGCDVKEDPTLAENMARVEVEGESPLFPMTWPYIVAADAA